MGKAFNNMNVKMIEKERCMRFKATGEMEIDVGVLVNSNTLLWEFRNYLVGLEVEAGSKISMMLAKDPETILRVMSFIPGGFDIIIVAEPLPGAAYCPFTDQALTFNREVRLLFLWDLKMELVDACYPQIMFVPKGNRLKFLIREKIDSLIAEKGNVKKQK